jgi:hypothetical protein
VLGNIVLLAMRTTFRVRLEYIGHFRWNFQILIWIVLNFHAVMLPGFRHVIIIVAAHFVPRISTYQPPASGNYPLPFKTFPHYTHTSITPLYKLLHTLCTLAFYMKRNQKRERHRCCQFSNSSALKVRT